MSMEPSCFTYAMCSAFLTAVTGALWISVEAAWGLQLNACSIVQVSGSLSCSHRNCIQATSVWKERKGWCQPTSTSSAKNPSEEGFDLADVLEDSQRSWATLHWWNCLLEQSCGWLFHSKPNQMPLQKSFTTSKASGISPWKDAGSGNGAQCCKAPLVRPGLWCTAPGMVTKGKPVCLFSQWTLSEWDVPPWADPAVGG